MTDDELAMYIGRRILSDAKKLSQFMPDFAARFCVEVDGLAFQVVVSLDTDVEDDGWVSLH